MLAVLLGIIPPQILGFFSGCATYICGSVRDVYKEKVKPFNPEDELMKITPEEARASKAPKLQIMS